MGKPLGDDLRRKFLFAYDQGEGTLEELAGRFLVSLGWAKKISAARNRSGQAERVPHKPGCKPRVGAEQQKLVIAWEEEVWACYQRHQSERISTPRATSVGSPGSGDHSFNSPSSASSNSRSIG